jgi:hypothetical protein
VGEGAQPGEIVELDAAVPEGHQAALAQLSQDAVREEAASLIETVLNGGNSVRHA